MRSNNQPPKLTSKLKPAQSATPASPSTPKRPVTPPATPKRPVTPPATPKIPATPPLAPKRPPSPVDTSAQEMPTSRVSKIERGGGGVDLVGLMLMLILGIVISAGLGYAYFYVSHAVIHHIIVSPLIGGAIAFLLCGVAIYLATCRNIVIAFIFGALVGIGVCGVYWGAKYLDFVSQKQASIIGYYDSQGLTLPTADAITNQINQELRNATGESGFMGFVHLLAAEGMTFEMYSRRRLFTVTTSETGDLGVELSGTRRRYSIDISPADTPLVWGAEIFVIALFAGLGGVGVASRPYSAQLKRWIHYKYIGQVSRRDINSFLYALYRNDPIDAGALVDTKNIKDEYPYLDVSVASDGTKSTNGVVKAVLYQLKPNGRGTDAKVVFDEELENVLPILNAGRRKKMPAYRGKYKF